MEEEFLTVKRTEWQEALERACASREAAQKAIDALMQMERAATKRELERLKQKNKE